MANPRRMSIKGVSILGHYGLADYIVHYEKGSHSSERLSKFYFSRPIVGVS